MTNYQNRNIFGNYIYRYYRGVMKRMINIIENLTTYAKIRLENITNNAIFNFWHFMPLSMSIMFIMVLFASF